VYTGGVGRHAQAKQRKVQQGIGRNGNYTTYTYSMECRKLVGRVARIACLGVRGAI
jgi:hypothetical protein